MLIAALLLSTLAAQPQQSNNSGQGAFRIRVETEVVLVNVVARDKQGKPMQDLKAEDFTVLHDRHDNLGLRFDAARQVTRIGVHIIDGSESVADDSGNSGKGSRQDPGCRCTHGLVGVSNEFF